MVTTLVSDLSPLKGMPLRVLHIDDCLRLTDVSPLLEIPTLEQILAPKTAHNIHLLKSLSRLRYISFEMNYDVNRPAHTSEEFWAMDTPATLEDLAKQRRYAELERVLRIRLATYNSVETWLEYLRITSVIVAQGHQEKYREICTEVLLRTGDSHPEPTLKICSLAPGFSKADLDRLLNTVLTQQPNFRENSWVLLSCAMASYRLGRWRETVELLKNYSTEHGSSRATACSILAMAYHQQGNAAESNGALTKAQRTTQGEFTNPHGDPGHWHDTLIAQFFLQEAEQLIGNQTSASEAQR